jgi:SIR2-like protein
MDEAGEVGERMQSADDLQFRLLNPDAGERFVFVLGSAVTAPAGPGEPGVPGVTALVRSMRAKLGKLTSKGLLGGDPAATYQAAIRLMRRRLGPESVDELIRDAVQSCLLPRKTTITLSPFAFRPSGELAVDPEEITEAWLLPPAVKAIGELVMIGGRQYGQDILTTNFDPLIGISIARAGGHYFRISMAESGYINSMWGTVPRIVHLHGFWSPPESMHLASEISVPRPKLLRSLHWVLDQATVVVIGYGGWDDVLMRCLRKIAKGNGTTRILWAFYPSDEATIREQSRHVLDTLAPGVESGHVEFFKGVDAHRFLPAVRDSVANKAALVRGALSYYVSEGLAGETENTRGYWATITPHIPQLRSLVEEEFHISIEKLGVMHRGFDAAQTLSDPEDRLRYVVEYLIRHRYGSWVQVGVESPMLEEIRRSRTAPSSSSE